MTLFDLLEKQRLCVWMVNEVLSAPNDRERSNMVLYNLQYSPPLNVYAYRTVVAAFANAAESAGCTRAAAVYRGVLRKS